MRISDWSSDVCASDLSMGLQADLVIVNADGVAVREALQQQVVQLAADSGQADQTDQRGGIFVRLATQLAPQDRLLFQAVARIVLSDEAGTLIQQTGTAPMPGMTKMAPAAETPAWRDPSEAHAATQPVSAGTSYPPVPKLVLDNGLGGFTPDGREYVITLNPGRSEEHTSELQSLMRISYAAFC